MYAYMYFAVMLKKKLVLIFLESWWPKSGWPNSSLSFTETLITPLAVAFSIFKSFIFS